MGRLRFMLGLLCGLASALAVAAAPDPPPAEFYFRIADIESMEISPSGRWLAMRTGQGIARTMLVVADVRDLRQLVPVARYADADITWFGWLNDERLLYSVGDRRRGGADQRFGEGLFAVRRDGTETRTLISVHPGGDDRRVPLSQRHGLLHVPGDGGEEIIVGEYLQSNTKEPLGVVPKRLNVVEGRARLVAENTPPYAFQWWFDAKGRPRALTTKHRGREALYWHGGGPDDGWRKVVEDAGLGLPFRPRFVDAAGQLYVTAPHGPDGSNVLKRFDLERGVPHAEPLVSTPGFDFLGGMVAETPGGTALGVRVVTDAESTVWFDARLKALQQEADRRLPGRINRLVCRRCSEPDMVVLVHSWSDRDPGLYVLHRAGSNDWRLLARTRSDVDPQRMARRDFERVRARDGLEFPVWITHPPGVPEKEPKAAVVLVHGGPWVRGGHWRWDPESQFLASRGYVVIEPEFRGSLGYGSKLFTAGIGQWGLAIRTTSPTPCNGPSTRVTSTPAGSASPAAATAATLP